MIKYCLEQWNKNKDNLEKIFYKKDWNKCSYLDLVKVIIIEVLNPDSKYEWDADKVSEIDDGDYSGTLLFLFPIKTYVPSERDYLTTFIDYGSCSGCDTLKRIQEYGLSFSSYGQVVEYMRLCKDIVMNMKIFNNDGWRSREEFESVEFKEESLQEVDEED